MISHRDLMLAAAVSRPFDRPGWVYELKYDGFRALGIREGKSARLLSRRGNDMGPAYPEIVTCLLELPDLVLDGELVMLDARGHPQFDRLRRRLALKRPDTIALAARKEPAAIFAFDLLELEGKDMRPLPLLRRKEALRKALRQSERIRYLTHIGENGERLFAAAEQLGLEGILAKRADSPYRRGRTSDWLKIKTGAGRAIDVERKKWNE